MSSLDAVPAEWAGGDLADALVAAQRGDRVAVHHVFERSKRKVYAVARRRGLRAFDAEDAVGEFATALMDPSAERYHPGKEPAHFFINRAADNAARRARRRVRRGRGAGLAADALAETQGDRAGIGAGRASRSVPACSLAAEIEDPRAPRASSTVDASMDSRALLRRLDASDADLVYLRFAREIPVCRLASRAGLSRHVVTRRLAALVARLRRRSA